MPRGSKRSTRDELCACIVECLAVAKATTYTDADKVEKITEMLEETYTTDLGIYIQKGDVGFDRMNPGAPEGMYLVEGRGPKKPAVVIAWLSERHLEGLVGALVRDVGYRSRLVGAITDAVIAKYDSMRLALSSHLVELIDEMQKHGLDIAGRLNTTHRQYKTRDSFVEHQTKIAQDTISMIMNHAGHLRTIKQRKEETPDADDARDQVDGVAQPRRRARRPRG